MKREDMREKDFCIYCSGGASRVVKFYSNEENCIKYKPKKIIYDGNNKDVFKILEERFEGDFLYFDIETLIELDRGKIHTTTSSFIHKVLDEFSIDFLFCFGDKILKKGLIESYKNRLINFHPSILPSFKGLNAIDQANSFSVDFLGNTAHFIDERIDTGKIIVQTAMLQEDFECYEDVLELQFPMMKMILRDLLDYQVSDEDVLEELVNRKKPFLIPTKCNQ